MDQKWRTTNSVVALFLVCVAILPSSESQATSCSSNTEFDLCFLIDRSGSICDTDPNFNYSNPNDVTCDNWKFTVDFVYKFVLSITVGPNNVRVAVVIFDDYGWLMWNLSRYLDHMDLLDAIANNLTYVKGQTTNTQAGLNLMADKVFNAVDRPQAQKTAIIITDGKPTNLSETWKAIERVHSLNITTFVVGVTNQIDKITLRRLSSLPQQENVTYFIASTYSSIDTVRTLILGQTCLLTTTTTTTTTRTTTPKTKSITSNTTSPTTFPNLPPTSATTTIPTTFPAVSTVTNPSINLSSYSPDIHPGNNLSLTSTNAAFPTHSSYLNSQWNSSTPYKTVTGNMSIVISNMTVSTASLGHTITTPITGSGNITTTTGLPAAESGGNTTTTTMTTASVSQSTSLGSPVPEMNETYDDTSPSLSSTAFSVSPSATTTSTPCATNSFQCYNAIYFESVDPLIGPIAGGTKVTINGTWPWPSEISVKGIYIGNKYKGDIEEIISLRGLDQIVFITPPADDVEDNLPVVVQFSLYSLDKTNYSSFNISTNRNFSYSYNPKLWEVFPREHLVSGGTTLTGAGSNLTSVAYPWIEASVVVCIYGKTVCSRSVRTKPCKTSAVKNQVYQTDIVCVMPQIDLPPIFLDILDNITVPSNLTFNYTYRAKRNVDSTTATLSRHKRSSPPGSVQSLTGPNGRDTADIYLRIVFDGYQGNNDLNGILQDTRFYFFTAPEITSTHEVVYFNPEEDNTIAVSGKHMMRGCGKEHYFVRLGKGNCSITELTDNQLTCAPPKTVPENTNEFDYFFCDQRFTIVVSVGDKTFYYRCLQYTGPDSPPPGCPTDCWNNSNCTWKWIRIVLIVGLVIGLILLLFVIILIICLIVVCVRNRKRSKAELRIHNMRSVSMMPASIGSSLQILNDMTPKETVQYLTPEDYQDGADCTSFELNGN